MERAAEAAALASAACANIENADDEDDDPLDKFMEDIAKEVKVFRGNNATTSTKLNGNITKTIKQEPLSINTKGLVTKIITKTVKNEVKVSLINFDV
jgi:ABC-type sulfate transport system substrate-binding protein